MVTDKMYIGSTLSPALRFYHHLVTAESSNDALQSAIQADGLEHFTLFIMEVVEFPKGLSYNDKVRHLRAVEQRYIDKYPREQLYNSMNSSSK